MSRWVEAFEAHPVHERLKTLTGLLSEVKDTNEEPSPESIESLDRIELISKQAETALASVDPVLSNKSNLDEIDAPLQSLVGQLNQYLGNENEAYLNKANVYGDNLLGALSKLFRIENSGAFEGVTDGMKSFRQSVGQYMRYVKEDHEDLENRIKASKAQFQGLEDRITSEKSRLDNLGAQFQQQFSESQENRKLASQEIEKSAERSLREQEDSFEERSGKFFEEQESTFLKLLEQTKDYKEKVENIAQIVADTGLAGGYQKLANEERKAARFWQSVTIFSFLLLIISAFFTLSATLGNSTSIQEFIGRVGVTATVGLLSAYTANQAKHHQTLERSSRKRQLALASIDLYLSSMPEEERDAIKRELTKSFFADDLTVSNEKATSKDSEVDSDSNALLSELIKKIPNQPN